MNTALSGSAQLISRDRCVHNPFMAPAAVSVPHRTTAYCYHEPSIASRSRSVERS